MAVEGEARETNCALRKAKETTQVGQYLGGAREGQFSREMKEATGQVDSGRTKVLGKRRD